MQSERSLVIPSQRECKQKGRWLSRLSVKENGKVAGYPVSGVTLTHLPKLLRLKLQGLVDMDLHMAIFVQDAILQTVGGINIASENWNRKFKGSRES